MDVFKITPVAKPRMTQSDKWNTRKIVADYLLYKDLLNIEARKRKFQLGDMINVHFYIPMPQSWSESKKIEMEDQPHQGRPDIDNLLKGFMDALLVEDGNIWFVTAAKFWGREGMIVVIGEKEELKANLPTKGIKLDQDDLTESPTTHDLRVG